MPTIDDKPEMSSDSGDPDLQKFKIAFEMASDRKRSSLFKDKRDWKHYQLIKKKGDDTSYPKHVGPTFSRSLGTMRSSTHKMHMLQRKGLDTEEHSLLSALKNAYDSKSMVEVKVIAKKHGGIISIFETSLKTPDIRALTFSMDSTAITILQLRRSEVADDGVKSLLEALSRNKSLTWLDLHGNKISSAGAKHLGAALGENTSLQDLSLSYNQLGDEGAEHLGAALKKNTSLLDLYLLHTAMGDVGAQYIGEALKQNTCLQNLELGRNQIGDVGAEHLGQALKLNTGLHTLSLIENQIGDAGAAHLGEGLKQNTSLQKLRLYGNQIGDRGAAHLGKGLKHNTRLQKLSLEENQIGDLGAEHIGSALQQNTTLKSLSLDRNKIGHLGAKHIGSALSHNTSLKSLSLWWNQITDVGVAALKQITRLDYLGLGGQEVSKAGRSKTVYLEKEQSSLHARSSEDIDSETSGTSESAESVCREESEMEWSVPEGCFSQRFTHDKGGELQKLDSDVVLKVPEGAVPQGKIFTIIGQVHTHLSQYNHCMRNSDEYIAGPVAEFYIAEGGSFEKHVEIRIPHCLRKGRKDAVRVLQGCDNNFEEITSSEDMTYQIEVGFVSIFTKHFTKFIVTNTDTVKEITDALITVAASHDVTERKSIIQLRLMLHSHCAGLNDFICKRQQFLDPGMKEIRRMKVTLPERDEPVPFPTIDLQLTIDEEERSSWRITNGQERNVKVTRRLNGRDVLKLPSNGARHRSEKLENFILESNSKTEPLSCKLRYEFMYDGITDVTPEQGELPVVYPDRGQKRRSSESSSLWDEHNEEQMGLIIQDPEMDKLLTESVPKLRVVLRLRDTWAHLCSMRVVTAQEKEYMQTKSPSVHDQVESLINHISRGPKWRFHGLLRACVETGQNYVISEIYHLDPADYKLSEDCDVGRQETHL